MFSITTTLDDAAGTELLEAKSLEEWQTFTKAVFADQLLTIRTQKAQKQTPVIVEPDTSTWDVQITDAKDDSAPVDVTP